VDVTRLVETMQVSMDLASAHVVSAGTVLGRLRQDPKWVIGELRRLSSEIKGVANRFTKSTSDLPDNLKFSALSFEEAVRALAGALLMAATGLQHQDTDMVRLAQIAQEQGVVMARASIGSLFEPALPPEIS
jgi:hypothetical protein